MFEATGVLRGLGCSTISRSYRGGQRGLYGVWVYTLYIDAIEAGYIGVHIGVCVYILYQIAYRDRHIGVR